MQEINVRPSTNYDLSQQVGQSSLNYSSLNYSSLNYIVVAQTIKDPDLLGNAQVAFNHFVQTGQGWALLIGLVLGYMLRSMTSYG